MGLLEAEVHASLRSFLRVKNYPFWSHHLTMARLISRAIRLKRSALIQTGSTIPRYWVSYLIPSLLSSEPIVLVIPAIWHMRLLNEEILHLQRWLESYNPVRIVDRLPPQPLPGLTIIDPQAWLSDRLTDPASAWATVPTLIDSAGGLLDWTQQVFTLKLTPTDWEAQAHQYPATRNSLRDLRISLTQSLFRRPPNPYSFYGLITEEWEPLAREFQRLQISQQLTPPLQRFGQGLKDDNHLIWATCDREHGQLTLHLSPIVVASHLQPLWKDSPVVLIGGFLDSEKMAPTYRQQIGLADTLCLQFAPTRQTEAIQLYLPDRLPLPNTPEFKDAMLAQIYALTHHYQSETGSIAILVDDVPLKAQIAASLAGQFGSQVQLEKPLRQGILVCGWDYWQQNQHQYLPPGLTIMVTLPIPSLEHPLVAERVAYLKRQRKDWFRLYLLPTALRSLQQAVMPLRETQAMVAVLDSRVNTRSYGTRILQALEPYAKVNYLEDGRWLLRRGMV